MARSMKNSVRRTLAQFMGISAATTVAPLGVVTLRHALETPQPLKSQLLGEARLYPWRQRSIFYKVVGNATAPPLVFLHSPETGCSAQEFQPIIEQLARDYCIYALDLLGFGLSDRPDIAYTSDLYAELCQDFLHDVVEQPATLVASRLSCNSAVEVASRTPELCAALVLISPLALRGDPQASPLKAWIERPFVKTLLYPLLCTRLAFLLTHKRGQNSQADFAQFHAVTHQLGAAHAAVASLAGKFSIDTLVEFEQLQQPVLLVWGTHALENYHYLTSLRNPTQNCQTRAVEMIPNAGLTVHLEQPLPVAIAMQNWLAALTSDVSPTPVEPEIRVAPDPLPDAIATPLSPVKEAIGVETPVSQPAIIAYCVRCKRKTIVQDAKEFIMKNGRLAIRGTCSTCGTRITRIGGLS